MTSKTITRFKCDWCGSGADVPHDPRTPAPLPKHWAHVEFRGARADLCWRCAERFEAVLQSPHEPQPAPVVAAVVPRSRVRTAMARLAGRLDGAKPALRPGRYKPPWALEGRLVLGGAGVFVALVLGVGASVTGRVPVIFATPDSSTPTAVAERIETSSPNAATTAAATEEGGTAEVTASPSTTGATTGAATEAEPTQAAATPASPTPPPAASPVGIAGSGGPVTAIGDSVMLAAAGDLSRVLGAVDMDAAVGRQASDVIEILRARDAAGTLGSSVVLHIGDNGPMDAAQVEEMLQLLSDVPTVLVVNLRVARPWEGANNAVLADVTSRHPNAVLVDWAGASANRPDLLWDDGIHLRPAGAAVYADLVAQQLRTAVASTSVRQAATNATPTPTPAAATPTPASTVASSVPTLSLTADVSVQVRVTVDGAVAFSGAIAAGETRSWDASSTVQVWTNDAANLSVTLNGQALGPISTAVGHPTWNTIDWTWRVN